MKIRNLRSNSGPQKVLQGTQKPKHSNVDDHLCTWDEIKGRFEKPGILIGNGASIAVWDKFKYDSLYKEAISTNHKWRLSDESRRIFKQLKTRNFERVLESLRLAILIDEILGINTIQIKKQYKLIQNALAESVNLVHIPWDRLSVGDVLKKLNKALGHYDTIFSTNYDLLIYWAIMESKDGFKDYFFSEEFDQFNTEIWNENTTKTIYLHGGLHLYKTISGRTLKRTAKKNQNLLSLFGKSYKDGAVPLIITEGTAKDKFASIARSDYLSFGFEAFKNFKKPLVVFGHSLGENDNHLVKAISGWRKRPLAFSVKSGNSSKTIARKVELINKFPAAQHFFFEATTHPLGSPGIKIEIEDL